MRRHRLARCHAVADLRREALRRLPWPVAEFLEGGADDEWSLGNNRRAFARYELLPRALAPVREIDTAVEVLGSRLALPLLLAPTGASRLYHHAGEVAAARAAARAGIYYALSTYSSQTLEEVARAGDGPKMFQLFTSPGWERSVALIERAAAAGYDALCLTVDTTAPPNKERDVRTGLARATLTARSVASVLLHPRWLLGLVRYGPPQLANLGVGVREAHVAQWVEAAHLDWEVVRRVRDLWPRRLAVKGLLMPAEARRAVEIGADAIILSNHGGRQLDGVAAPIDLMAEVAAAVGTQLELLLDSGIRRGTDVLKALALGARACGIGRAYLYGLAAGGEEGVIRAIEILREELVRDMTLLGTSRVADVDAARVRRVGTA